MGTGNQTMEAAMRMTILFALLMSVISFAGGQSKKLNPLPKELQGDIVPNFFVLAMDNETELDRKGLKEEAQKNGAKRIALSFFASWCENCREEFKSLRKNASKLKENGVQIYLIDVGEKIIREGKKVSDFVEEFSGGSFPFYFDPGANLLKDFGFIERSATQFALPIILVLDADLRVLGAFTEAGDDFPQILWGDL
jgi:thiol-disulfide isomerase/thioredoxin